MEPTAEEIVERAARDSYGRLVAYLASRSGDVAGAEDALGDAFFAALRHWPSDGVPEKPEAWLLRVARNRLIDESRRRRVREDSQESLRGIELEAHEEGAMMDEFPDERLKLLFVCAHPAIDAAARTPLMLQSVLGIEAARIASAFLVSPTAMAQRLVRAKNKIKAAAIPFRVPDATEWSERLGFVLDAIYSAYTAGWGVAGESASTTGGLAAEAIALGRTLASLMPGEPEALGLLALMLHCEARSAARLGPKGEFIPLDRQDPGRWSRTLREEAEGFLRAASRHGQPGRYQLEAAIQSIHAQRARTGRIEWEEIALLYEGLIRVFPGIGARVGRAVALAETGRIEEGIRALEELGPDTAADYQPYWASRAHLLRLANRVGEARRAYERAASLTDDPALRSHLLEQAATLPKTS